MPSLEPPLGPRSAAFITAAVLLGVFFRLFLLDGPSGGDDVRYLTFASHLTSLDRVEQLDHAAGRLVLLALIGLPLKAFGHVVFVSVAMIVVATLTDLVAIRFVHRRAGAHAALLAAALLAVSPLAAFYGSRVLPDTPLGLWILWAVIAFVDGRSRVLVGVLVGLAYATKDPGVLLLPPLVLATMLAQGTWRERARGAGLLAAGFGVVLIGETLAFWLFTGDPLFRSHATAAAHNARIGAMSAAQFLVACGGNVAEVFDHARELFLPVLLGGPALAWLAWRDRALRAIGLVGLFYLLFLVAGTSSLSGLVPLPFHIRYFQPMVPLAVIAVAIAAAPWLVVPATRAVLTVGMGCLVFFLGLRPILRLSGSNFRAPHLAQVRDAVEILVPSGRPIRVEPCLVPAMPFVLHPTMVGRVEALSATISPGYYLLPSRITPTGCTPEDVAVRIRALPELFRLSRDQRPYNRLRIGARWQPYDPPLVVYVATASAAAAPTAPLSPR